MKELNDLALDWANGKITLNVALELAYERGVSESARTESVEPTLRPIVHAPVSKGSLPVLAGFEPIPARSEGDVRCMCCRGRCTCGGKDISVVAPDDGTTWGNNVDYER
jgi:hypothetical protein